jgi:hypothetical protein
MHQAKLISKSKGKEIIIKQYLKKQNSLILTIIKVTTHSRNLNKAQEHTEIKAIIFQQIEWQARIGSRGLIEKRNILAQHLVIKI